MHPSKSRSHFESLGEDEMVDGGDGEGDSGGESVVVSGEMECRFDAD